MASGRALLMLLSLGLIAALLVGHVSACACVHHGEGSVIEPDCHSEHGEAKPANEQAGSDAFNARCICFVEQTLPIAASKAPAKEFKSGSAAATSGIFLDRVEFAAANVETSPALPLENELFGSIILKSLLPSRAPPRL
jgi:hypothetical protein